VLVADGKLTQLKLDGENLTIVRLGAFGKVKSRLTIRTAAIASIDFKPATKFVPGHIEVHAGQIGENLSQPMFRQDRPSCALFLIDEADKFDEIASALGVTVPIVSDAPDAPATSDEDNRLSTLRLAWGGGAALLAVVLFILLMPDA